MRPRSAESNHCFLLRGARVALSATSAEPLDLQIADGIVQSLSSSLSDSQAQEVIDLDGLLVLPGLLNAHDHLEFGLFPRLGNRVYSDARSWARDIYQPERFPICELLQIPKATRLFWGGIKNLLSGVTTVCHHNRYESEVFDAEFPLRVVKHYGWSHSFDFSQDLQKDFAQTPPGAPFLIHLAEGTTDESKSEIYQLDRMGLLTSRTVLIHGVALGLPEWELVRRRGASIIWCPSSNLFTLGKTLTLSDVSQGIRAALGNDSPLTADGDLLDEIHCAVAQGCNEEQAYEMVTTSAASVLALNQGEGSIRVSGVADLLIVSDPGNTPAECLALLTQEVVRGIVLGGAIQLLSPQLAVRVPASLRKTLVPMVFGEAPWLVGDSVRRHWEVTSRLLGKECFLSGRKICVG